MNNVIYKERIRPYDPEKDIDWAPWVFATAESNGHAVFHTDDHNGTVLLRYFVYELPSEVIRYAIEHVDKLRNNRTE